MPAYTIQCLQLPRKTNKEINRISRNFFWKNTELKKGLHMVSRDKICRPKKVRGLYLRKMQVVNSTF